MAIRQKPSGSWEIYYRNPITGKREAFSVGTQKEAIQQDALVKYRLKFERESFEKPDVEESEKQNEEMTFEDVLWLYLKSKLYSKDALKRQLFHMKFWVEKFRDTPFRQITKKHLVDAKFEFVSMGYKGNTMKRKFSGLKSLFHWALREELIEKCPSFPELPDTTPEHFVPPTKEEIVRLLKVAKPHLQRVIIFGFCFGARIGPCELFRIRWSDIDIPRETIRMPSSKKNRLEPWRELPIRRELVPLFEKWKDEDKDVNADGYLIHWKGKPVKHVSTRTWKHLLASAGITRRIRPYDLRHAFATESIAAGVDVGTVARMMGHRNPVMLLSYYQHVMDAQKKEAMEKLPCVSGAVCPEMA